MKRIKRDRRDTRLPRPTAHRFRPLRLEGLEPRAMLASHAPNGQDVTVTSYEDVAYIFRAFDFPWTDIDGNNLAGVKIASLPTVGTLQVGGAPATAGQLVPVASINAGQLLFRPPANAAGLPLTAFGFQVQDDGGTAVVNGEAGADLDPTPRTLSIKVFPVNDAPTGGNRTASMQPGSSYTPTPADFGFADPNDIPANSLLAVRIETLPAVGTLSVQGAAVNAGQIIPVQLMAAGRLNYTAPANVSGPFTSFTFRVQDDGGVANGGVDTEPIAHTFTFYAGAVSTVHQAPSGGNSTVTTFVDTPRLFKISDFPFTDADQPPDNPAGIRIASLPAVGELSVGGVSATAGMFVSANEMNAGLLRYTPLAGAVGSPYASFTFQAKDTGGTANGGLDLDPTPRVLTINVTPAPITNHQAPAGSDTSVTAFKDTARVFSTFDFPFTDPDQPPDSLAGIRIASLPTVGALSVNGVGATAGMFVSAADISAGGLQYLPPAGVSGANVASFTFQVKDTGGTANGGADLDASPNVLSINVSTERATKFGPGGLTQPVGLTFSPSGQLYVSNQWVNNVTVHTSASEGAGR